MKIYCVLDIDGDVVLATTNHELAYNRAKGADSGLIEVWEDEKHIGNVRVKGGLFEFQGT